MPIGIYDPKEYYQEQELQQFQEKFDEKDPNGNRYIDEGELPNLISIWYPKHLARSALKKAFATTATERTGKISCEEFIVIMIKATGARRRADLLDFTEYLDDFQIKELQKLFARYATDGSITQDGLPVLFNDLGLNNLDNQVLQTIIVEVDKDASGEIEFDEFCCMWVVLSNAKKRINYREFLTNAQIQLYRKTFELTDTSGNGSLDVKELHGMFRKLGFGFTQEHVEEEMRKTDADGNGSLSFDEFCTLMVGLGSEKRKQIVNKETYDVERLIAEGFAISDIKRAGFPLEMLRGHIGPKRLAVEGGYTPLEFRAAGFGAEEMLKAGFTPLELKCNGYSATALKNAGVSDQLLSKIALILLEKLNKGDFSLLPQQNTSAGADTRAAFEQQPAHMTPRIRYHVDYQPKLSKKFGK